MRYLGIHMYPHNKVQLVPGPDWPEPTERGEAFNHEWHRRMRHDHTPQENSAERNAANGRHFKVCGLLLMALSICGCQRTTPSQDTTMNQDGKEIAYFSVSSISYIEQTVFAVKLNGVEVGAGGGSLITGVAVPLGPQVMTWRDGGTGETFEAVNQPVLTRPSPEMKYLGVHIYPDKTVEVIPAPFWPEKTERGKKILQEQETKHGQ